MSITRTRSMVAMSQRRWQCSWYGRLFCIIYQHATGNVRKITVAECTTLSLYTHLFVLSCTTSRWVVRRRQTWLPRIKSPGGDGSTVPGLSYWKSVSSYGRTHVLDLLNLSHW